MLTVLYTLTMHRNLLMIKFYCIWSQLKDILIKSNHHFLCCASAAVCFARLAVQPQRFQGCLRLIKVFWDDFFTYCNNFDCKAQMAFYFIKQD